jgi:hypothetical protein
MRRRDMESDRIAHALTRLASAIDRLEAATRSPPADPRLAALEALEERHRRLRDGASEALARLDRLIAAQRQSAEPAEEA